MQIENKTAPQNWGAASRPGSKSARVAQVIEVQTVVGKGTGEEPNRIITEYWSLNGELLAVNDPKTNSFESHILPAR